MKFSLVIPCYNAEQDLGTTIIEAHRAAAAISPDFELIFVDDGSNDRTRELVEDARQRLPGIQSIRLPRNSGKGAAVARGIIESDGEIVGFTDADLPYGTEPLYQMWAYLFTHPACAAISGTRYHKNAWRHVRPQLIRRWASTIFAYFARRLVKTVTDTQCGCKMFRRSLVLPVIMTLQTSGFAFDVELMAKLERGGVHIAEIPVSLVRQGSASSVRMQSAFKMFIDVFSLYRTL